MKQFFTTKTWMMAGAIVLSMNFTATAQEYSDSHLKASRQAIGAIGATQPFNAVLLELSRALSVELTKKDPHLGEQISATVSEETLNLAGRRADLETEAALIYAKVFTEEELNAIATFYNSPAGKKLLSEGAIVSREINKAVGIWQRGLARDLAEKVSKRMAEIAKQVDTEGAAAAPAATE